MFTFSPVFPRMNGANSIAGALKVVKIYGLSRVAGNVSNAAIYSDFWVEAQVSPNPARNPRAGDPKKETIPLPPVGISQDVPATRLVFCWQRKTPTLG